MTIDREWVLNYGRETEQKLREFFRLNPQEKGDYGLPLARWLALYLWAEKETVCDPCIREEGGTFAIVLAGRRLLAWSEATQKPFYSSILLEGLDGLRKNPERYDFSDLPIFLPSPRTVSDRSDTVSKQVKKPYEKPAIVDLPNPTEQDISRRYEEAKDLVEHIRAERCPSGCSLSFDRTVVAGDPRILICLSFKLGAWTFEHRETWILASMKQSEKENEATWRSNFGGFDASMHLLFDRAARDLMKFLGKGSR